ncbi:unnamed protein product [Closterium sp. NIES-53]
MGELRSYLGFALATANPSLFLRTDTSLLPFYVLVYVNDLAFATADSEALTLVKSELQKRHTCTDLGELRRARRTITLTPSHMVHQFLQRFVFQFSSPQPTPLSTSHSLSAPPSDESVEPSGPYPELVGCLMYLMTCTRPDLAYPLSLLARYVAPGMGLVLGGRGLVVLTGHADASWVDDSATQRSSQGYTFSLGSGSVSWRSTCSSSVLSSSCKAEIYAGAMAAHELCWLTYLLTDLGEQHRSPLVLYVDNKAMIALCQEHRMEHRTKHIALRYFLARELQQRGQLRLAYVATINGSEVLAPPSPGQRRRLGRMYGSSSRLSIVGELLDRLRRAAADRCGIAVDQGARQLQLTSLGDGWAVDQEGHFNQEVDGAVRRPEKVTWGCPGRPGNLLGADNSRRMHNGASRANRQRASASVRTAVFYGATLDNRSAAALAHRRPAVLAGRLSAVLARLLYTTLAGVVRRPAAAIVTMVDPVVNAGGADTLEARLADARKRHADGEYGTIPLLIVELGIRSQWATEHPSRPDSPRPVRNEGGVDDEVDGGARVSSNNGMKQREVIKVDGGVDRNQTRVQQSTAAADSSRADVDGQRRSPLRNGGGLSAMTHVTMGGIAPTYGYFMFSSDRITVAPLQGRRDLITASGEFCAAHLLTFMVISTCCSPVVQLALKSCRERLDAGHQAWHFILSTYQIRDDPYIAQLEEKMTHIRMGEQESATDYYNWARRILAEMQMAGAEYLTASYISHISLDEDSITSYILQDEVMQEAKQPTELLPQANYAAPTKLNQQQGQHRKPSGSGRSMENVDEKRSIRDKGRGGGGRRRECWICHDPDHLSYECRDCDDSDKDDAKGGRGRSTSRRPRQDAQPRKEKQTSKKTSSTKDVDNSSGKSRVAAAVQANSMAVLLDSGCSHHLMGTKTVFVEMAPSDGVKHVRGFNGALQPVEGRGTVALQGEARKRVLIPDVLYVPGIQANLLSAGQLKESGVHLQGDGDEMLLVAATGDVLGRARYNGRVLCTDLRPCSTRSSPAKVVALRTIVSATKSTPDRLHARLAHVSVDTINSAAKHAVATGLNITPSTGADPPCVSCVGGKLARHTFPDKGSDAEEALAVVHIDLCGPFRVVAKDGSLYFLLLKDRHTRFVWVMPVAKKTDVLREFQKWLVLVERQAKKSVLMLRSDRGGEFLGKEFTDFVDGKGIVHDLTCPYTPQQNGMAEREMRTAVESMGVQHHWWHLTLRQAVWVRIFLERSTTPPRTNPYQLLTRKKPDLTLARVSGCMVQFMVPEQQRGWKLAPKARWGLHLGVSPESKGWEVLNLTDNKVVTSVEVIFYETLSLEVWKAKFGLASGRTQAHPPTDTSTATVPLLAEVDEPADEDFVEVLPPSPVLAPPFPVADRPESTPVSATGNEGSLEASPVAPASGIAGHRQGAKLVDQDGKPSSTGEQQTGELVKQEAAAGVQSTKELLKSAGGRARRLPERLSFHACLPPAAFTAVYDEVDGDLLYDDAEEDDELPELDPDMHADPKHRWDIATMTIKEALASWKGEAVKAAMEEEIHSLVGMGTWELVKRPLGVNIMKNRWVLTTKYRLNDTVEREKARLVVKGFTQVCGADYNETYSPVSSYVTLRIFLSIVAVFDLNLMALDGVLLGAGWKKSQVDEALYFKTSDDGVTCWVLVYVDDLLAASSSPAMLKELKELLEAAFELREISPIVKYLGLEIVRDTPARKLWLHQQGYADKLRRRFLDEEQGGRVPKAPTSVDAYAELTFDDEEAQEREEEEYRQKVGSLQFAATTTRPDITFACSKLGSGLTVRSDQHGREVNRCLAYLADTRDTALEFGGKPESLELIGYVDADDAGKEGRRLCFLLAEFKLLDAGKPTILRVDNKSAITVAEGLGLTGNLKHMERRYAWLQHMVRHGKFVLKYIPTTEQLADFLTKALHFPAFNWCSVAIGQVRLADVACARQGSFNGSEVLASPSPGQRRRLCRMYGSSSRPSTVGELLDRLRRAATDRCGIAVDQGARQLQLTGLGDGWAIDQDGQFDREVDGAVRRPEK